MSRTIGIDLGTTYSCVATMVQGRPVVIPNKLGLLTTPSIFAITKEGKKLVGQLARRQIMTNPKSTIYAAKRLIGRRYESEEVKIARKNCTYEIVKGPHDDVRIMLQGREYSLPEVSAFVLMEMKNVASDYYGEEVTQAVITVPAYFNDGQRQGTKDAGTIAGLDVLRIINEPTAAAIAYGMTKQKSEEKIAVYDLGGGTFDISILDLTEGVYEVISSAGDTYLGGEDFDQRIIEYITDKFRKEQGIDLRDDKLALQRLKEAAEKAKCDLSEMTSTEITLPFIASDGPNPKHLHHTFTRRELEDLTGDLISKSVEICRETLEMAELSTKDIDEVILVGGQTRMPKVQEAVRAFFGKDLCKGVNPDEVVAIGAAVQANALTEDKTDVLLLDVTPISLGINTFGGKFKRIIERNTTIPVNKSHIFTTSHDNQTSVKVVILQGDSDEAEKNEVLGQFTLTGVPEAKRGTPEIEVSFDVNSNGILSVGAKDLKSGTFESLTLTATSGLTEEEVRKMAEEAKLYEPEFK
jgi:molecular chaperone DnaK